MVYFDRCVGSKYLTSLEVWNLKMQILLYGASCFSNHLWLWCPLTYLGYVGHWFSRTTETTHSCSRSKLFGTSGLIRFVGYCFASIALLGVDAAHQLTGLVVHMVLRLFVFWYSFLLVSQLELSSPEPPRIEFHDPCEREAYSSTRWTIGWYPSITGRVLHWPCWFCRSKRLE